MNVDQYNRLMDTLGEIIERMPEKPDKSNSVTPGPLRKVAQSQALYSVLVALDGWIEGARENHDAMEHRGESSGEECWRTFTPADIRRMVNDTARELGLTEFPLSTIAKEDQV